MVLGLLIWNVYLTTQISNFVESEKDTNLKIDMLKGDLKIMEYDLITARDSLRILNKIVDEKLDDTVVVFDDLEEPNSDID